MESSDHSAVCVVHYARMDEETSSVPLNITLTKYDFSIMEQNITAAQTLYRASVVSVGILLNCVVIFVVSVSRQLHYPRHIFWVAISISECLLLVDSGTELFAVHYRDDLACVLVVIFYPIDYSVLLICLSMAAFDRYLSIVRYEWYKANVTNRGVILLISITSAVVIIVLTSTFWTGYKSIYSCTTDFVKVFWAFHWNLFLGIVCVILHCKIFIETKALIRKYVPKFRRAPVTVRFSVKSSSRQPSHASGFESKSTAEQVVFTVPENPSGTTRGGNPSILSQDSQLPSSIALHQMAIPECDPDSDLPLASQSVNNQEATENFPWNLNRSKISRLELQAALNLSINILPFWLCAFPVACYSIAIFWCIRLDSSCDIILLTWNYFWDVFIFHCVYNPVMYMATCSEFRRALRHIAKKLSTKFRVI